MTDFPCRPGCPLDAWHWRERSDLACKVDRQRNRADGWRALAVVLALALAAAVVGLVLS